MQSIATDNEHNMTSNNLIYKISPRDLWGTAEKAGVFTGAEIDIQDGVIHFSTKEQAQETADKHFAGQKDLFLVAIDAEKLGPALKYEVSRGGDLFPHLYAELALDTVVWVREIPTDANGHHVLPFDGA